jgi:hypothetical protein
MRDEDKTREQLIRELTEMRRWLGELRKSTDRLRRREEELHNSDVLYRTIIDTAPS